jgi:acyl carrier protein
MSDMKDKIREFILDAAQRKGLSTISDDEVLTDNGVVDSLTIFRLVSFLEDGFGVRIGDEEIVNDNFQSVNAIEDFVSGKLSKKASTVQR